MKKLAYIFLATASLGLVACGGSNADGNDHDHDHDTADSTHMDADHDNETMTEEEIVMEKDGITLTSVNSPQYDAPMLSIAEMGMNSESGKYEFKYQVESYDLGVQTEDAESKMCANSDKGQHIHFILDNQPYSAHYEPMVEKTKDEIKDGNHVLLAFLSRSYHESIKSDAAYSLISFNANNGELTMGESVSEPHMFYSRPKGTYLGANEIGKVLLDFYLVNCDLSKDGYHVRATINGTEFMIYNWMPYFMEGLPEGDNTIKLELLDADGNMVDSPFNPVERTVKLAMEEPMP